MTGDIAIVGAGPAGSAAAYLLAQAGRSVTLFEQHRFPRDKVCGECLSATGIDVLERIGLGERLKRLSPILLSRSQIHLTSGKSLGLELPRPMWGISRRAFDSFLLDAARQAGAQVIQPARCEAIERTSQPTIRVRFLESNEMATWAGNHVLIADGKGSFCLHPAPRTGDFGIKTHFRNVDGPRDTIELFGCDGFYGGLAAIEDDGWNCAFSVPESLLRKHRGDIDHLFADVLSQNKLLNERLEPAERVSEWLAAPLPRFAVQNHWIAGITPIGNAAAAIEPIGGEGMGLALQSAELAADAIQKANLRPLSPAYRRVWRLRRPACRLAAQVVSRPQLSDRLGHLLERGFLGNAVFRLLGK